MERQEFIRVITPVLQQGSYEEDVVELSLALKFVVDECGPDGEAALRKFCLPSQQLIRRMGG